MLFDIFSVCLSEKKKTDSLSKLPFSLCFFMLWPECYMLLIKLFQTFYPNKQGSILPKTTKKVQILIHNKIGKGRNFRNIKVHLKRNRERINRWLMFLFYPLWHSCVEWLLDWSFIFLHYPSRAVVVQWIVTIWEPEHHRWGQRIQSF